MVNGSAIAAGAGGTRRLHSSQDGPVQMNEAWLARCRNWRSASISLLNAGRKGKALAPGECSVSLSNTGSIYIEAIHSILKKSRKRRVYCPGEVKESSSEGRSEQEGKMEQPRLEMESMFQMEEKVFRADTCELMRSVAEKQVSIVGWEENSCSRVQEVRLKREEEKSSVNYKIYDKNKDELWKHFNDMITFVMSLGKDAVCFKKCKAVS